MMATRTLTQTFVNFRNISVHNRGSIVAEFRSFYVSIPQDDTASLVQNHDAEIGYGGGGFSSLPPQWVDSVEEIQYEISKIKQRIKDLSALHDRHLNRPTLDDNVEEEHVIEITTQEITQMFHQCQRLIQGISSRSRGACKSEQIMVRNVISSLASTVQDLSQNFKKAQSKYLKRMKNREETSKQFFDTGIGADNSPFLQEEADIDELYDKGFTTAQLQQVEDNSQMISQREKEIQNIVRSIFDLNEIFKDLSVMVIDQGTILDRIDYNVEQSSMQVEKGLEQLKKGEKYQKSSRKMLCILFLAVALIIMLITLVITKTKK
ncbi:syntaxin-16-like isoform X2 [Rhopilema esculentum]|uniref:syntaxin-16-like isoform X2 n=1 Tax=Rhopilema esculentum TaxID=499914 RepID=UPI0031CFB6A5